MKIVTQVGIIFSICWISQIIEKLLPFSFPASVIGMILLFILLCRALSLADAAIQRLGAQVNPKIVLSVLAAKLG